MNDEKILNAEQGAEAVHPQNEFGAEKHAAHAEPHEPFRTFATEEDWQSEIDRIIGARLRDDRLTREKAERFDKITAAREESEKIISGSAQNFPHANGNAEPDFDFDEELKNPKFASLIAENGISAEDAYYLCHKNEIAARARAAVNADISARRGRIYESGTGAYPAASVFVNPSRLTDGQIDDIFERVQSGEKITF